MVFKWSVERIPKINPLHYAQGHFTESDMLNHSLTSHRQLILKLLGHFDHGAEKLKQTNKMIANVKIRSESNYQYIDLIM